MIYDPALESPQKVYVIREDGTKTWVADFADVGLARWYIRVATEEMMRLANHKMVYEMVSS